jgi:hypothetical protein
MQAEEMLQHVQGKVFPFLKDLNGTESNFTHHMKNAVFIIPKPALLVEAVKTIDEIFEIMEQDSPEKGQAFQDIQGDVYEMLLSEIATAGKNGQFRTPRHIIKLMAELVRAATGPPHRRSGLRFRRLSARGLPVHRHRFGEKGGRTKIFRPMRTVLSAPRWRRDSPRRRRPFCRHPSSATTSMPPWCAWG